MSKFSFEDLKSDASTSFKNYLTLWKQRFTWKHWKQRFSISRALKAFGVNKGGDIPKSLLSLALAYVLFGLFQGAATVIKPPTGVNPAQIKELHNFVTVMLDSYRALLNSMLIQAIYVTLKVALVYMALRWAAWRWPKFYRLFGLAAVAAIACIACLMINEVRFLVEEVSSFKHSATNADLTTDIALLHNIFTYFFVNFFAWFMRLFFLGLTLAYWFHSPRLGKKVAAGVMMVLNLGLFFAFGVGLALRHGDFSGLLQGYLNYMIMSGIFMLFGVTALIKRLADYISEKYFPCGPDHWEAAGSDKPPAAPPA